MDIAQANWIKTQKKSFPTLLSLIHTLVVVISWAVLLLLRRNKKKRWIIRISMKKNCFFFFGFFFMSIKNVDLESFLLKTLSLNFKIIKMRPTRSVHWHKFGSIFASAIANSIFFLHFFMLIKEFNLCENLRIESFCEITSGSSENYDKTRKSCILCATHFTLLNYDSSL